MKLIWKRPTKPGWYWCRKDGSGVRHLIKIYWSLNEECLCVSGQDDTGHGPELLLKEVDWKWSDRRIPEPKEG